VNALTWHELPAGHSSIRAISSHLARARQRFIGNPQLAAAGVHALVINEVVGAHDQLLPGELAGYLFELEHGGADAAALACWPDPCGLDNCASPSLDGLLDPQTLQPRATWWVAKAYTDGVGARVWSRSTDSSLVTLATRRARDTGYPEVLLGYFDPHSRRAPAEVDVRVTVRGLDRVRSLRGARHLLARSTRIPSAGQAPITALVCSLPRVLSVRGGSAAVTVRALRLHEAVVITFAPGPSPAPPPRD
jgi:hypothetical protein